TSRSDERASAALGNYEEDRLHGPEHRPFGATWATCPDREMIRTGRAGAAGTWPRSHRSAEGGRKRSAQGALTDAPDGPRDRFASRLRHVEDGERLRPRGVEEHGEGRRLPLGQTCIGGP